MMQHNDIWPELPYETFKSTATLLHMSLQAIGKLKLFTPFEPHWANVALWLTASGLTTGIIEHHMQYFSVDVDFIDHRCLIHTSRGDCKTFELKSRSVAEFVEILFLNLEQVGVDLKINFMPQEVPNPIAFDQDTTIREYNRELARRWWRILLSTHAVMQRYHARFTGISPPIGFMWGTFDLRDARYIHQKVGGIENEGFIRRNAMDAPQIEMGWWNGNPAYEKPAYFSFCYPTPKNIEKATISPSEARWDATLGEFILDYDVVRQAKDPEKMLLDFFESTYFASAKIAGWDPQLLGSGVPV